MTGRCESAVPATFKFVVLTPSQVGAIAAALANGAPPAALARQYGVSVRTVYRCRERARCAWAVGTVAGWRAEFALTGMGPVRMTPWYPSEGAE